MKTSRSHKSMSLKSDSLLIARLQIIYYAHMLVSILMPSAVIALSLGDIVLFLQEGQFFREHFDAGQSFTLLGRGRQRFPIHGV